MFLISFNVINEFLYPNEEMVDETYGTFSPK